LFFVIVFVFFFFILRWRRLHDNVDGSMTATAARQQRRQLNDNGSGVSTATTVAAPQQRQRLHDNGSSSMVTVVT